MILPPRHTLEQVSGSNWIHRALVCGTHTEEEARVEDLHTCLLQDAPGECQQNTDSLGDEVNKMTKPLPPSTFYRLCSILCAQAGIWREEETCHPYMRDNF